jgi:hypothetical protein
VSYNEVSNHIRYYTNTKMKSAQQNSDVQFSLNNVFYSYKIKFSVNQHLNSSLSETEEQPSVCTGIMKTATVVTAHTQVPVYWHNAINKYCCNLQHIHLYPWSGLVLNLVNHKYHFETDNGWMVSAPISDTSPFQTAHKIQQLMSSTIRQLVADYAV